MARKGKKSGLFLAGQVRDKYALGRSFMTSPERFAKKVGLDPKQLACPNIVHEAFGRGQAFAEAAVAAEIAPDKRSMTKLKKLATKHLGRDYDVSLVPFGLKFREKVASVSGEITATGTGTVTFLDGDADVDG